MNCPGSAITPEEDPPNHFRDKTTRMLEPADVEPPPPLIPPDQVLLTPPVERVVHDEGVELRVRLQREEASRHVQALVRAEVAAAQQLDARGYGRGEHIPVQ